MPATQEGACVPRSQIQPIYLSPISKCGYGRAFADFELVRKEFREPKSSYQRYDDFSYAQQAIRLGVSLSSQTHYEGKNGGVLIELHKKMEPAAAERISASFSASQRIRSVLAQAFF
jgi:hypothetical protein